MSEILLIILYSELLVFLYSEFFVSQPTNVELHLCRSARSRETSSAADFPNYHHCQHPLHHYQNIIIKKTFPIITSVSIIVSIIGLWLPAQDSSSSNLNWRPEEVELVKNDFCRSSEIQKWKSSDFLTRLETGDCTNMLLGQKLNGKIFLHISQKLTLSTHTKS